MVDGYADYLYYHSNQYFCSDRRVATNGGPGTAPEHPPRRGPRVNAVLFQGMRDTLFNFSEGYANYLCLRREGGDVRLLSYQSGHNAAHLVPDPGERNLPPGNVYDGECGSLHLTTAIGLSSRNISRACPAQQTSCRPSPACRLQGRRGAGQPGHDLAERRRDVGRRAGDPSDCRHRIGPAGRRGSWHRRRAGQFRGRRDSTCEAHA